jgi:hypothetical protein
VRTNRASVFVFVALVIGCGSPPPPSGECIHVDGRGSASADGSDARPFRTIADALPHAREGDVVCLSPGEHVSPGAIGTSVVVRGAGDTGTTPPSGIVAATAGCTLAAGVDVTSATTEGTRDVSAVLVTTGDVDVALEHLYVRGCDYGVVARARSTSLTEVTLTDVRVGLAVDRGASAVIERSTIDVRTETADEIACGVCAGGGAVVDVRTTDVAADLLGVAIGGAPSDLRVTGSRLHDAFAGVLVGNASSPADSVDLGEGTTIDDLVGLRLGTMAIPGLNAVSHATTVQVHGVTFTATRPDALGLQIAHVAEATVEQTTFTGHDYASLAAIDGDFTLGAGVELRTARSGVGLVVGGLVDGVAPPTTLTVMAPLVSTGSDTVRHVLVQGGGTLAILARVDLSGGAIGLQAIDMASITSSDVVHVMDVSGAAVSLAATSETTLSSIEAILAGEARGLDVADGATLTVTGGEITGGEFGVHARDTATLMLRGLAIHDATEGGVVVEGAGAPATIEDTTITDSGLGLAVHDGRAATVRGLVVEGSSGSGIEVVRASLDIDGGMLDGNRGAAIAFEDGDGSVTHLVLRGTSERPDSRADEVRIVSTDGAEHSVEVGDNMFHIVEGRSCASGCSVVLASGLGAIGVVRPNCLTADPGVVGTYTLASQDSGMIQEPVASVWADGLLGRTTTAAWLAGSAIAIPLPAALETASVPQIAIPPGF